MLMENIFQTHLHSENLIAASYGTYSLYIILSLIILIIIFSLRKADRSNKEDYFAFETTNNLRGLAVIFLMVGHLSIHLIDSTQFLEYAGNWAVIIFLLMSGIGMAKTYNIVDVSHTFLEKRIRRLLFPLWISLALFYILDFILINRSYPIKSMILHFLGITGPTLPLSTEWFITYILYLYVIFFLVAKIKTSPFIKFSIILFSLFVTSLFIKNIEILDSTLAIWVQYTIVFPSGILVGLYDKKIFYLLDSFYRSSPIIFMSSMILLFLGYFELTNNVSYINSILISNIIDCLVKSLRPTFLILAIAMLAFILDTHLIRSLPLSILGSYSFEIYLLHFPFMQSYDFFLFRKPLFLHFIIYLLLIILLSYILKKITTSLNHLFIVVK